MNNLLKRILLWSLLWFWFWFLCFLGFIQNLVWMEEFKIISLNNPMMLSFLANRFLIWFFVWAIWFITVHPVFLFRFYPFLRWICAWVFVSIPFAIWVFLSPEDISNPWFVFWIIVLFWAIIWMIIDLIVTKLFWEWDELKIKK